MVVEVLEISVEAGCLIDEEGLEAGPVVCIDAVDDVLGVNVIVDGTVNLYYLRIHHM